MNAAQLHLILNHVPIVGLLFALAFTAYGWWRRDASLINAGKWAIIISVLLTIPTYLSGEPAEEIVEHQTNVSHDIIHEHEEAAELAFILMLVLGGLTFFSWWKQRSSRLWTTIVLVAGLVVFAFMARVGHLGGLIQHPELRDSVEAVEAGESHEADND